MSIEWHEITDDTLSWPALGSNVLIGYRNQNTDEGEVQESVLGGVVDRHLKSMGRLVGFGMTGRGFAIVPFDDLNALSRAWWADAPELPS